MVYSPIEITNKIGGYQRQLLKQSAIKIKIKLKI